MSKVVILNYQPECACNYLAYTASLSSVYRVSATERRIPAEPRQLLPAIVRNVPQAG